MVYNQFGRCRHKNVAELEGRAVKILLLGPDDGKPKKNTSTLREKIGPYNEKTCVEPFYPFVYKPWHPLARLLKGMIALLTRVIFSACPFGNKWHRLGTFIKTRYGYLSRFVRREKTKKLTREPFVSRVCFTTPNHI